MDCDNPIKTIVRFENGTDYSFSPDQNLTVCENDLVITQRAETLGQAYGWGRPISYTDVWI